MRNASWCLTFLLAMVTPLLVLESCQAIPDAPGVAPFTPVPSTEVSSPIATPTLAAKLLPPANVMQQSWVAYRQRFIQGNGRVIDREAEQRSTSEGQAYAMLRAVMIGDRDTFDRTLQWAERNLQRTTNGQRSDQLWAWKWGRNAAGEWTILDRNFASDADVDAITALILASRRWRHPEYQTLARTKLHDLWQRSTVTRVNQKSRYLLPGPASVFQTKTVVQINPSYLAPYAFRLFAQVDRDHNWFSLVDSSYQILQQASSLSTVKLPNDWVLLNLTTGKVQPLRVANPGTSDYGFDAYRIWWRLSLDAAWFKEPRARQYLQTYLVHLRQLWRSQQKIPARINLQGKPVFAYEATSQYGMLYAALRLVDPATARQIEQQKLTPQYRNGFWDNDSAYYTQNLVWLGLLPPATVAPFVKPQ